MKLNKIFPYLLFVFVLIGVSQWSQLFETLRSFTQSSEPFSTINDPVLTQFISNKTSVQIDLIRLVDSNKPFAAMSGLPGNPQLFMSTTLYETFDQQTTEYVLLHEIGHYLHNHTVKETLWVLGLIIIGMILVSRLTIPASKPVRALILGVVFGVGLIQVGRMYEYEADRYALSKLDHPQVMVTATEIFQKSAVQAPSVVEFILYRRVPYEKRIEMALEMGAR